MNTGAHFAETDRRIHLRRLGKDLGQQPATKLYHASNKVNDGLVRLDLSYNEISSRGVLVIAQALEDNDRLEVLRLDGNRYACFAQQHDRTTWRVCAFGIESIKDKFGACAAGIALI